MCNMWILKLIKTKLRTLDNGENASANNRSTYILQSFFFLQMSMPKSLIAVVANVGWQDGTLEYRNKILELPFMFLSYMLKFYVFVFYNYNTHDVIR